MLYSHVSSAVKNVSGSSSLESSTTLPTKLFITLNKEELYVTTCAG